MLTSNVFDMLYDQAKVLPDEERLAFLLGQCDDSKEAEQILNEIRSWEEYNAKGQ